MTSAGQPKDSRQINLTDPDSALVRKSRRDSYEQAYNAQVVVEAEGGQPILATDVLTTPSDANEGIRERRGNREEAMRKKVTSDEGRQIYRRDGFESVLSIRRRSQSDRLL